MGMPEIRTELARIEGLVPGIKAAYDYAPDAAPLNLPAFINVIDSGTFVTPRMMGIRESVHLIKAKALVQYQSSLENAERVIEKILYDFTNTLDHYKTLNATERVLDADVLDYEYGSITLANQPDQPFVGISFTVQVREIEIPVIYSATGG